MAIDAHTHLDLPAFDPDRAEVLGRAASAGVRGWVVCAADPTDWDRVQALGETHGMPWTLGVHPWWEAELSDEEVQQALTDLANRPTPHGIGELGLDHRRVTTPEARVRQAETTRTQLALARERNVPVVFHCVRATGKLLRLIERDGLPEAGGMIHSFGGPSELVDKAVGLGLHLSYCASITRSKQAAAAFVRTPDGSVLLETDAPDQALVRGERGEPADLIALAEHGAALRATTAEALLGLTESNAVRLFPALTLQ